jgi:hypothetical protein
MASSAALGDRFLSAACETKPDRLGCCGHDGATAQAATGREEPLEIRRSSVSWLKDRIMRVAQKRAPDRVIHNENNDPYLERWYLIPRNKWFNIYLHHFLRSDEDRALHDHPWINASVLLEGDYWEHLPGHNIPVLRRPGAIYFRRAKQLHRVQLFKDFGRDAKGRFKSWELPVWTLFITGPEIREWGFACPKGWIPHFEFTSRDGNFTGKGCD